MLGIPMLRLLFSFSGFFVVVEVWYVRSFWYVYPHVVGGMHSRLI